MTLQEEKEICYLCNKTFYIGDMENFCNGFDEDGKDISLCQNCYHSGKCNECDMVIHNINELIYLIDNFKCIDTCTICLLDEEKRKNINLNKIIENYEQIVKILKSYKNTNTDPNIDYIDINEEIINYNLSIYNKKEKQIPYYNQIINKCKYEKYFSKAENIVVDNNVNTNTDKVGPSKELRKTYILYKFRNIVNKVISKNKKDDFKNRFINNIHLFIENYNKLLINRKNDKIKKNRIQINNNKLRYLVNKLILNIRIRKFLIKKENNSPENVNAKVLNSIIKSNIKYKDINCFNILLQGNRGIIDIYSNYYKEYIIDKKDDDIKIISKFHDKNKNRFMRLIELFYLIKKEDQLYKSKYLFNYYTLAKIHKKNNNFEIFINLLKSKIKDDDIKNLDINIENNSNTIDCLNRSCPDHSNDANEFCNDCKEDLIKCKKCGIKFWTDEDIKYCEDCE